MKKYSEIKRYFKKVDPVIGKVMKSLDYSEWFSENVSTTDNDYFVALTKSIIGQQLSGKAAGTIYGRFSDLLDGNITPPNVLVLDDEKLRKAGLSWAKVSYVKDLAVHVEDNKLDFGKMKSLDDEQVIKELMVVKGIGRWTGEMFLMFTLRREDVFSFGDLGLRRGLEKVYGLDNPTEKQSRNVVDVWKPYRTYGSIGLWHSLEAK